jgi:hypothetical protein
MVFRKFFEVFLMVFLVFYGFFFVVESRSSLAESSTNLAESGSHLAVHTHVQNGSNGLRENSVKMHARAFLLKFWMK